MGAPARSQDNRLGFRVRAGLTWLLLIGLLFWLFASMHLDTGLIRQKLPSMLGLHLSPDGFIQGAVLSIVITVISMLFCILLAVVTAMGRLSSSALAFGCATFYVSLFRGTPLLVQVLIIYLALPQVGIVMGAFTSGIIALSLNYGAYLAETIRSGVLSVPRGQKEAAMALGLSRWTIITHVITPQALRIIIPPAGSQFISMIKDSSLVSLMGLWELNFLAQSYGRSTYHYMEMLTSAAAIYWLLSMVLELLQTRLERHFARGYEPHDRKDAS
ncbi:MULTISPECIES: amino acid ABC transporter permease [Lonsdalea]|uniref:Amino acid ABC transporter permease n=2 Tax=Lonsdalea TaxID=1082702 RepID=A0ACD1JF17_9GAMM|nr:MULTISPECIES: amino acid ABC transporter permease [Lonsdalea]OSN01123.1 amino acid ABC transporter permease [Lonsdalea populi]QPQ25810.1 amino acid ABC transporter permease [Lonsdalea populi]RAT15390.1 amino acid ABC transporter permease [Lonsdalea quercina]RAT17513.1 amino acid ABC transporter permease [Lonsdalea quercina]RAT21037.1 amino acid ABC transporter permease [Lonsdalea populi]